MATTTAWWGQAPVQAYGADVGPILAGGREDFEKGNVYGLRAGTPVSLPVSAAVEWEDSQHIVLKTADGFLNLLHISPSAPVGAQISPGQVVGTVSRQVGPVTDPVSKVSYNSSGNILEVGLYDSARRAAGRDNPSPADFGGIYNPTSTLSRWAAGQITPEEKVPVTPDSPIQAPPAGPALAPWVLLVGLGLVLLLVLKGG